MVFEDAKVSTKGQIFNNQLLIGAHRTGKWGCLKSNILPLSDENAKKIKSENQDFVSLSLLAYLLYRPFETGLYRHLYSYPKCRLLSLYRSSG